MQQTNTTEPASYQVLEIRRKRPTLTAWDFETKSEAERFALEQTKQASKEAVIVYGSTAALIPTNKPKWVTP